MPSVKKTATASTTATVKSEKTPKVEKTAKTEKTEKPSTPPVKEKKPRTPKAEKAEKTEESTPRVRVEVTHDTVLADFETLGKRIDDFVESRKNGDKNTGIRELRSIRSALNQLQNHTRRAFKIKNRVKREPQPNSGFMKPVSISKELASFCGIDPSGQYSRTEITKKVCEYVKSNSLNDSADKRVINPDSKLQKLLNFNPSNPPMELNKKTGKTEPAKLTYFLLQKYMKHHYPTSA
jgi:chromatin remodeling complex protein RSC6